MIDKIIEIASTIASGVIVIALFEFLRGIGSKNNDNLKK
jgi:hypothetical protein